MPPPPPLAIYAKLLHIIRGELTDFYGPKADSNIKHILLRGIKGEGRQKGRGCWQPLPASEIKTLN